jgi:hypothetical protein
MRKSAAENLPEMAGKSEQTRRGQHSVQKNTHHAANAGPALFTLAPIY